MSSIQIPLHPHVLFLRNLSQHFQTYQAEIPSENETRLRCELCGEDFINGSPSIYCCEKCKFYIHTSCVRLATLQIQHPRHEHPLELQQKPDVGLRDSYYPCVRGCKYELPARDATRTLQVEKYYCSILQEASDGESRLQFAHEHPLTTFPVRTGVDCGGCETPISEEEACGCRECNIFLHEACATAPLEIQHHPFHPEHPLYLSYDSSEKGRCHACRSQCLVMYRCVECQLNFDLSCVISTMPRDDDDDDDGERGDISRRPSVIDHPLHPHQLSSYHSKTHTKITCSICREWIPSENFFGCSDCSFFLHGSCAQPPVDAIQHYLHPEHTLTFAQCPDDKKVHKCALCEYQIRSYSYCYNCQMCDLLIHPFCASATLSDLEKGVARTVQYPFHKHELKLYCNVGRKWCTVCNGNICEKTSACKCCSKKCDVELHKSCLQISSHLVHPSHSPHALTLCFSPPNKYSRCRRCHMTIEGSFSFSCGECNFYLHVNCAQKPNMKHPFHEHHLFYFEIDCYRIANNRKCRACHKSCWIDFFWCKRCDYILHYECSLFPPTLKSEHHWEPLVLRESFIEDERAEYYCDICERRRDPNKWVYYCETCNYDFVAHVECALSPVELKVIEEVDFIRREEDIQRQEEEIRVSQEQVDAKEASLRPLMEEVKSMRAKVDLQRMELYKRKAKHAKWIDMGGSKKMSLLEEKKTWIQLMANRRN